MSGIGLIHNNLLMPLFRYFKKALEFDSDLVLFDLGEGFFHNAESFQLLAIEQYEYQQGLQGH